MSRYSLSTCKLFTVMDILEIYLIFFTGNPNSAWIFCQVSRNVMVLWCLALKDSFAVWNLSNSCTCENVVGMCLLTHCRRDFACSCAVVDKISTKRNALCGCIPFSPIFPLSIYFLIFCPFYFFPYFFFSFALPVFFFQILSILSLSTRIVTTPFPGRRL